MRPSLFKLGIGLIILGMIWLSFIFDEGDRISEKFSLKSSESGEIELNLEGQDIGYYKIFIPEFSGQGVFVQILDQHLNVISDGIVETKMSVGYFNFEGGEMVVKVTNLSEENLNLEIEFGDTNAREMIIPGIISLAGGLMIVIALFFKLRDYRIEQPDENIS